MDVLSNFMEANLKRRENYTSAQNVASGMRGEETDLPREARACLGQLNFQVKEINLDRGRT